MYLALGDSVANGEGSVAVAGQNLPVRVDLVLEGEPLKGTVDFPQQNALGLPLQNVSQQGNNVHFEVLPAPNTAVFDGDVVGADLLKARAHDLVGEFGAVAFAAEVTQIQMPQAGGHDLFGGICSVLVGKMPVPAQNALFEAPRPADGVL